MADLRVGFDTVARSPLMRLVAVAYVLLAILLFSVSFPFLIAASREFPDKVELATALGLLSTAVTATSFVVSLVVANRLYARFGISAGALASADRVHARVRDVARAVLVRDRRRVPVRPAGHPARRLQRGLERVLQRRPGDRRAQVLGFNDGVPGQVGTVLSGILLLLTAGLSGLEPVFWLGLGTAVIATLVVHRDPTAVCGQPSHARSDRGSPSRSSKVDPACPRHSTAPMSVACCSPR